MSSESASRYHSPRRQQQAQETRRQILAAARRLFAEQGYAATSISQVAAEAGVSVATIYQSVGPKRVLVLGLIELVDQQAGVPDLWRSLEKATGAGEVIDAAVALTRRFQEVGGDVMATLMSAAPVDKDVAAAYAEGMRRHRMGMRQIAARLVKMGALRADVPERRAADVLGVLTSSDTYSSLRTDYGWSLDECEAWITATLRTLLLDDAAPR